MVKAKKLFSASEIGQFSFCSVYWFLRKQGYSISSSKKNAYGVKMHNKMGKKTYRIRVLIRLSSILIGLGSVLLIIILIFELLF